MSRSINFLLIAAISAVVFLGCKKERSFRGANPGDEIVFGGTAGSASGFSSSKTKGGDGNSSVAGTFAVTGLDSCRMDTCSSYARDDSDADETYYFDWEDFEGGEGFGSSDANALLGASENDVQTKTEYSGHKENVGGKTYERIDWKAGDKVRIFGDNVMTSGGAPSEMVYTVTSPSIKPGDARRSSASLEKESVGTMGLRWDSGNADFYAVYPGDSPSKLSVINGLYLTLFDVTVKLPEGQNTFTKTTSGNHTEVRPDMELAAMMAVSRDVPPASSVQLDFLPLVTTFRITMSNSLPNDDMKINKVSLVYSPSAPTPVLPLSGDYAVKYDKASGTTLSSHSSAGLQPVNTSSITSPAQEISVNLGTDAVALTKNNGNSFSVTLFAVPVMHKGLQLKINVTQGGNTEERILDLKQKSPGNWLQFEPYRKYDITVGTRNRMEDHLDVSSTLIVSPYYGGSLLGWVKSYRTDGVETKPLPWNVVGYSYINETGPFISTPPAWLTGFTPNGNGVSDPSASETFSATVSAQSAVLTNPNPRTTALRGKGEVGTKAEPIDLSKVPVGNSPFFSIPNGATASTYTSNPMSTANCYVVTRPGWYKIPVVYGNAFKNGNDNTAAYTSSASGANVLKKFIRHDGNTITKPWIKDNGINLDNGVAELIWQDFPFLVQNSEFDNNSKQFIVFHVSQANIHEGNAVIALKESATGYIVWSWHIWVYGGDDLKSINVKNNKEKSGNPNGQNNFDFLSENLGSCYDSGELITYPASNVWVKVSNGRKTKVIEIGRVSGPSCLSTYNNPYYQWGRKDPMSPSNGGNSDKLLFNKVGLAYQGFSIKNWESYGTPLSANDEIAETIRDPRTLNKSNSMDNLYYNLWDTSCDEISGSSIYEARFESVKKSVYDPCPPGFCLSPNGAFSGFTESGDNSGNSSEFNVSGSFNKGWNFRTVLKDDPDPVIAPTIFFPASGFRSLNDGVLYYVGSSSYYWSSIPYYAVGGCLLYFSSSYVGPMYNGARSGGCSLRPVAEN